MRRLTPNLSLAVLMLGTGLGIGLGLSGAPTRGIATDGQIRGTMNIVEGGTTYRLHPGTAVVGIEWRDRMIRTLSVSSGHTFQVSIPPGRYTVFIRYVHDPGSPAADCLRTRQPNGLMANMPTLVPTSAVEVVTEHSAHINFSCIIVNGIG